MFLAKESTVRRYVRMARLELGLDPSTQAFIPCEPDAGREAEVDWGTTTAVLAGETVRLKFFCMRSKYSGKHFVRLYPCERQAFFDAHIKAFEFFGGIFPVLIYDNLITAVQKVLRGRGRIEQDGFRKFKAFHSFEARFCTPASGHEKGGVEGLVGFARRNYMVPVPEAANLEELNEQILRQCLDYGSHKMAGRSQSVDTLYDEETAYLIAAPEATYSNIQPHDVRADKYATAMVDKNRYSVPWRYVGCKLKVILSVAQVEIFFGGKRLAVHERLYANNKWSLTPEHYLELIQQRPMSFNSARPIKQWREHWPQALHQAGEVDAAVELALEKDIRTSDGVQHILTYTKETVDPIAPLTN